jgi:hypothetical protein
MRRSVEDPTLGKQALQRLTTAKKDAAGRTCPGFKPLAQQDATLFKSLMVGEHCLHGFTNRDIRSRLTSTRLLRSCADDPKKASARVSRCFRRLHAHGTSTPASCTDHLCDRQRTHGERIYPLAETRAGE